MMSAPWRYLGIRRIRGIWSRLVTKKSVSERDGLVGAKLHRTANKPPLLFSTFRSNRVSVCLDRGSQIPCRFLNALEIRLVLHSAGRSSPTIPGTDLPVHVGTWGDIIGNLLNGWDDFKVFNTCPSPGVGDGPHSVFPEPVRVYWVDRCGIRAPVGSKRSGSFRLNRKVVVGIHQSAPPRLCNNAR